MGGRKSSRSVDRAGNDDRRGGVDGCLRGNKCWNTRNCRAEANRITVERFDNGEDPLRQKRWENSSLLLLYLETAWFSFLRCITMQIDRNRFELFRDESVRTGSSQQIFQHLSKSYYRESEFSTVRERDRRKQLKS